MNASDKYMLITWYHDTSSDYEKHWHFETQIDFVTSKQLDDIAQLMKDNFITQWVKDPETVTLDTWKQGDGALVEFRNVTVKPVKIVETWSYKSEVVNHG